MKNIRKPNIYYNPKLFGNLILILIPTHNKQVNDSLILNYRSSVEIKVAQLSHECSYKLSSNNFN